MASSIPFARATSVSAGFYIVFLYTLYDYFFDFTTFVLDGFCQKRTRIYNTGVINNSVIFYVKRNL